MNVGGWLPCASLHRPAIAVIGDPPRANRCFAFGYFLPVNSKKADAGMRQRLLLAKCRPSDRKLKTGTPPGRAGGKANVIGTNLVACGSHHRPRIVDPDVVGLREIEFALMARDREIQSLHQLAVLRPTDVLLVVVAHVSECRSPWSRPEVGAASLQSERLRVAIPPRCRKIPPEVRSACGKVQLAPEFRPSDALSHAKHDSGGGA